MASCGAAAVPAGFEGRARPHACRMRRWSPAAMSASLSPAARADSKNAPGVTYLPGSVTHSEEVSVTGARQSASDCRAAVRHASRASRGPQPGRCPPEIASHIQAFVIAIEHVHGAALLPRLSVQLTQQQHRAWTGVNAEKAVTMRAILTPRVQSRAGSRQFCSMEARTCCAAQH